MTTRECFVIRTTDLAGVVEELVIPALTTNEMLSLPDEVPCFGEHGFDLVDFTNPEIYASVEAHWCQR